MKDNKGFTLIELLAVVIILGVLLLIAVPSVSSYISDSRKSTYIRSAEGYIDGVRQMITSREISVRRKDTTFYIPIECIGSEKGGDSPYGEWADAYVVVTYGDSKYEYYWTSTDANQKGILLTHSSLLDEDKIQDGISSIDNTVGIKPENVRTKIMMYEAIKEGEGDEAVIKCELAKDSSTGSTLEILPTSWIDEYGSL